MLKGDQITGETLATLYEQLTGKKSTPEQIADMQKRLDEVPPIQTLEGSK
jgi:hypothetical protein